MSAYTKTYTFTNGTTADGGQVDTEITNLGTSVNSITNDQINASAAIAISKTALGTFTAWGAYVPTITVSGGTTPTYTATFVSRYMQIGKLVVVQLWWVNSAGGTAGSGGNPLIFTLPVTAAQDGTGSSSLTWGMAQVYNGAATAAWLAAVCGASTTTAQLVIADAGDSTYANIAGGNQNNVSRAISALFAYEAA